MTPDEKKLYEGHRGRLAEKIGQGHLSPYEHWEYWLCGIVPRRDMRDLAKQMYRDCGGLLGILTTPYEKLIQIKGIGPAVAHQIENLRCVIMDGLLESLAKPCTIFQTNQQLRNYCRLQLGGKEIEEVYIVYLDDGHMLLDIEKHSGGNDVWAPVFPDRIMANAVNKHARYIILVHNHPSAYKSFSDEDFNMTNKIAKMLLPVKVCIEDHFVVSGGLLYSMRDTPGGGRYTDGMAPDTNDDEPSGF